MAVVDEMARREHRSRSEMLREMVRIATAERLAKGGDILGAVAELLAPLKEATDKMTDEEFDASLEQSIREVRDEQSRARHQRLAAGSVAAKRTKRATVGT